MALPCGAPPRTTFRPSFQETLTSTMRQTHTETVRRLSFFLSFLTDGRARARFGLFCFETAAVNAVVDSKFIVVTFVCRRALRVSVQTRCLFAVWNYRGRHRSSHHHCVGDREILAVPRVLAKYAKAIILSRVALIVADACTAVKSSSRVRWLAGCGRLAVKLTLASCVCVCVLSVARR